MTDGPLHAAETGAGSIPLVVDLDGTLSRTDTLHEALLELLSRDPAAVLAMPSWLASGPARFKACLADRNVVPGTALPLNEIVLERVRIAHAEGRPVLLVSAADQRQAAAAAEPLGLFDEVIGTRDGHNLKGRAKADYLVARFGRGGFDYIGDAKADLPVWSVARMAITVGAGPALRRAAEAVNEVVEHLDPPSGRARLLLRAMRPHQWSKNILLFLPVLAAHEPTKFGVVAVAFLAFSFTASAVYIINDLLDLTADRTHPRKRHRPFAAGVLSATFGGAAASFLLLVALVLALLTGSMSFLGVLGVYFVSTFAYSLFLKRRLLVDVITLAGLYTTRLIAGGTAAGLVLSPWLLGFAMFLFLGLAAIKRQAELTDQVATGRESAGRAYVVEDLPLLMGLALSSGIAAVLVLALYIASDEVQLLYQSPEYLWLTCMLVLYWQLRMVMKTHRGSMTDDPIVFATTDRVSQITILTAILLIPIATLL